MQDYLYKVFLNQWLQNEGNKNKKNIPRMIYKYQDLKLSNNSFECQVISNNSQS
jgi:hypothetical protein